MSLEELKKALIERKLEQSLYDPNSIRVRRGLELIDLNDENDASRPNSGDSEKGSSQSAPASHPDSPTSSKPSCISPQHNMRYAARRTDFTLSNTNIRYTEETDASIQATKDQRHQEERDNFGDPTKNNYDVEYVSDQAPHQQREQSPASVAEDQVDQVDQVEEVECRSLPAAGQYRHDESNHDEKVFDRGHNDHNKESNVSTLSEPHPDYSVDHHTEIDSTLKFYRYLKHQDLWEKIQDLCKREQMYVTKQSWDEALRLREMKNQLVLLMNKNLYENYDLDIDDEIRNIGRKIIADVRTRNEKRAKMCNSLMYSEEAQDLWKKWDREDDQLILKLENEANRDLFLSKLEEDWKRLTYLDKERMGQIYDRVIRQSDLQDELKLANAFGDATGRQKNFSHYSENK